MEAIKCPVCNGNGLVPNGFYNRTSETWSTSSAAPETCHSCTGRGYIFNHVAELYSCISAIENREPNLSEGTIKLIHDTLKNYKLF